MTKDKIRYLAKLSAIALSEKEIEEMKKEFDAILDFVWKLQQIPTDWVEKMYTPIENVRLNYQVDTDTKINKDCLLSNSPCPTDNDMIVIKSSTVEH